MKKLLNTLLVFTFTAPLGLAFAEPYVSASLGWGFDQKLKSITGDENLNYPGPVQNGPLLYSDAKYSNIKLKDALQAGIKAGYFFEFASNLGVEVEASYFQPNMRGQDVSISATNYAGGIGDIVASGIQGSAGCPLVPVAAICGTSPRNANSITERQLPARVKALQINLNAIYRYQELKDFIPYIGGGPSINIIRITGTGESGNFIDPVDPYGSQIVSAADAPRVHDTSVNVGLNFKVGAEYKLDQDWGIGAEYHYNWIPVDVSKFRSANNLSADLEMQSVNFVLTRHF